MLSDRALAELLVLLSDPDPEEDENDAVDDWVEEDYAKPGGYRPIIPDEVVAYYLQRVGFECNDIRVYVVVVY